MDDDAVDDDGGPDADNDDGGSDDDVDADDDGDSEADGASDDDVSLTVVFGAELAVNERVPALLGLAAVTDAAAGAGWR